MAGVDLPDRRGRWILLLDLLLVIVFALSGRASHTETLDPVGLLGTAWPFLAGCVVGHLVVRAWRRPTALWPTGVVIWIVTVAGGMGLRALTDAGTALSFVLVATGVLGLFLLLPRLIVSLWRRGANRAAAGRRSGPAR
ncbi:MAG TPA: DUF3054 domain-containing protein [Candidatus Avipropionibacterium avicola]|uniref:DUF3054 domain-containing protein n=1 Tax=Candidatus Avipropionibacterium avicola TaxID=2840701 RepID=A0A9D1H0U7_9ACTN|nr:DUF3054 domain-containing protein [Candidatus Avipropionibacterium avicola]